MHDEIGFNYRLPNLNAALGCAQLEQLDGFLAKKRLLAAAYDRAFADVPGVRFAREPDGTTSNYWLNAILLDEAQAGQRDELLGALNGAGFGARPAWTLMHQLPMFASCPRGDLGVAESSSVASSICRAAPAYRPAMTNGARNICFVTGGRADFGLQVWPMRAIREIAGLKLQLVAHRHASVAGIRLHHHEYPR